MFETRRFALALLACLTASQPAAAQEGSASGAAAVPSDKGLMTLTIFLRHDESQTLDEIMPV